MKNLSLLLFIIAGILYGLVIRDYQGEVNRMTAQVEATKRDIEIARAELASLEAQEEQLGTQLELAFQEIPKDNDQENLIRDIQKIAKETDFAFKALGFGKSFNSQVNTPQLMTTFSVEGPFSKLFTFMRSLEQNQRFLGMNNITLTMGENKKRERVVKTSLALYALYQE